MVIGILANSEQFLAICAQRRPFLNVAKK